MMKSTSNKILNRLIIFVLLGTLAYIFRTDLLNFKNRFYQQYFPCQRPITYQLGQFDQRFGISKKNFLAALTSAEQIWEKPVGLNLFEYASSGTLKINLIYDYRQDATVKLHQLGIIVKDDQATYDKLNADYITINKSYLVNKANLESLAAELDLRTIAYNKEIKNFNQGQDRVSPAEIKRLHAEEDIINQLWAEYKTRQNIFNDMVNEINALADTLNRLAQILNLSVNKFNTVGASRGREFEEGTYISSETGEEIDVYQYDNSTKLVRLLTHELGHALGLEHVSSTKAIMYYLNNGINEKLALADLLELKKHCGLK